MKLSEREEQELIDFLSGKEPSAKLRHDLDDPNSGVNHLLEQVQAAGSAGFQFDPCLLLEEPIADSLKSMDWPEGFSRNECRRNISQLIRSMLAEPTEDDLFHPKHKTIYLLAAQTVLTMLRSQDETTTMSSAETDTLNRPELQGEDRLRIERLFMEKFADIDSAMVEEHLLLHFAGLEPSEVAALCEVAGEMVESRERIAFAELKSIGDSLE